MATQQYELPEVTKQMAVRQSTPMDLLNIALTNGAAIDVIERLAALQEKAIKWEAEVHFNQAMNQAQAELERIAPDLNNPQTKSRYASYAKLDKAIRPIYTKFGFSLSFDTADCPLADHVRAVCYVSNSGHSRRYQIDIPCDGKGAKGGDVMTKTHATGAAMSYGMRYMLKNIFNIAIGEEDNDGNNAPQMDADEKNERLAHFPKCETFAELQEHFANSYREAKKIGDVYAENQFIAAKDKRKLELKKAGAQ